MPTNSFEQPGDDGRPASANRRRPRSSPFICRAMLRLHAAAVGTLWISGCMATLEHNLDRVLAPSAAANVLTLPYSGLMGLMQVLLRLL